MLSIKLKYLNIIGIIIHCIVIVRSEIVNPIGPTVVGEYAQCLLSLVEDNFPEGGLLVASNTFNASVSPIPGVRTALLRHVQSTARHAVQVFSPESDDPEDGLDHNDDDGRKLNHRHIEEFQAILLSDYYVIVVGGFTQFKNIILKLSALRSWNPRALFIVMCIRFYGPGEIITRYPERILTHLFRLNVINAVVMIPGAEDRRKVNIYGWKPFDPPNYCGYKNESAANRLVIENSCSRGVKEHNKSLFFEKTPHSMKGCQLEALVLVRPPFVYSESQEHNYFGIERMLIDELAHSLTFKIKYSTVYLQRGEKNGSTEWSGALGLLKEGKGDFVFGALFPDNDVHEDFEASISYFADAYAWVVPRADLSPAWMALVVIFETNVWTSALGGYVVSVMAWRLIAHWSHESPYHRSLDHCALNSWYTTLGFCSYMRPVGQSLRIFFISFTLYCVVFITAYQTKLIDVLKNPTFESQLSTPDDLVASKLRWGGLEELHDLFAESEDNLDAVISKYYIEIEDEVEALVDVVVNGNFSLLGSRLAVQEASTHSPQLSDNNGKLRYFTFETNVFSIPLEFVSLNGFPFMERLNYLLAAFKQMGVMSRILGEYGAWTARRRARLQREMGPQGEAGEDRPLSLEHLQGGFFVLIAGYVGGAVSLIFELIIFSDWFKKCVGKVLIWERQKKQRFFDMFRMN